MERKRLIRLILNGLWGLLVVVILLLFFKNRLAGLPGFLTKLKREPPAIVSGFKPREMAGFSCSFRSPEDLAIWKTNGTRLEPSGPLLGASDSWAKATYYPAEVPGLLWTDETMGVMDWRQADGFSFTAYNPQSWPIDLKVKIKDVSGNVYQKNAVLPPREQTTIRIPMAEIATRLDLSRVSYLNLFLWQPSTETVIYYSDLSFSSPGAPRSSSALVRFMGLEFPASARSGETVEGAFYFIVHQQLSGDNILLLRLRQGESLFPLARLDPPFPTSKWRPGQLAKIGPLPITIPETVPPGVYQLEAVLAQPLPDDGGPEYFFQSYDNPEIDGFAVNEITVTDDGGT
ncbi:MAG: hypothetical protein V1789_07370 [PVC group bacterium]